MLREVAWMIAGGLGGAVCFALGRWWTRQRNAVALLPIGPHQFAGILRNEGEHGLADQVEESAAEWPDEVVDALAAVWSTDDPDEHEGAGIG